MQDVTPTELPRRKREYLEEKN